MRGFSLLGEVYNSSDIDYILKCVGTPPTVTNNKKVTYYNTPSAFDIETSSFYDDDDKRAVMYAWTLGIDGYILMGRTWEEFTTVYQKLVEHLHLSLNHRFVVYVHNLGFEFQFLRKRLNWDKVFSIDHRKPIYALTKDGVEFRCSYLLSGYSLATLGKQLRKYPVQKMVGDLDYSLYRHSGTPLTDKEIGYCVNDVKVVLNYIRECIESDGDISRIPYTKTGYVRSYCRNACMYQGKSHKNNGWKYIEYSRLMEGLRLDVDEYQQLKRAFQGGFTHANAFYSGATLEDVTSYDFTSSYPAVMLSEKFPMSSAQRVEIKTDEEFRKNLQCYCCLFDVEISGLESTTLYEHPLSASRCFSVKGSIEDNGRIVSAEHLFTTLTEQDFFILEKFYKWESLKVGNFKRYKRAYLPTEFVRAILKLYSDKTTLKGVKGQEDVYMRSKEMINSCYGMTVTDICRDEITYSNGEWGTCAADLNSSIQRYNTSKKRFLYYPWGVWITAYARKNLFTGIYEFKNDYVYSDTDSIKVLNIDKHIEYINAYNEMITKKLQLAMKYHAIPFEQTRPKTIDGIEKPLGVWDYEGTYTRFKTLGAKRYLTESRNKKGELEISLTVSGVNKKSAIPYLLKKYDDVFNAFTEGLHIPAASDVGDIYTDDGVKIENPCGKSTHTYIDDEHQGVLTDYLGNTLEYHELSGTHLEPADYTMSLSASYVSYLLGIREYNK